MNSWNSTNGELRTFIYSGSEERLDKILAAAYTDLSRTQWQRLIDDGMVRVDGETGKASQRLQGEERIEILIPPINDPGLVAEHIPLEIYYDDQDMVIVDKPAGMVVHPSPGHRSGTLVNALLALYPDIAGIGGERRPGIVHRLDKETSGLIVVAKNDGALRALQAQFKKRTVKKTYLALVEGAMTSRQLKIDAPIGRDPNERKKMLVISSDSRAKTREAITYVHVEGRFRGDGPRDYTFVRCHPQTGRTHQIRVHLAYANHPIVGDETYGRHKQPILIDRHFLHASELILSRPSDGASLAFYSRLPQALQSILDSLEAC